MRTLNFYANETLSLTELDVKFALNLVHKCLPIFPQKKQIYILLLTRLCNQGFQLRLATGDFC